MPYFVVWGIIVSVYFQINAFTRSFLQDCVQKIYPECKQGCLVKAKKIIWEFFFGNKYRKIQINIFQINSFKWIVFTHWRTSLFRRRHKSCTGGKYGLTLAWKRIYDEGGRGEHIDIHLENWKYLGISQITNPTTQDLRTSRFIQGPPTYYVLWTNL